jgi:hypothetical protein
MKQYPAILLSILATVALTPPLSWASGEWLDSPAKPWNRPGQSVPRAPEDLDRDEIPPNCGSSGRPAATGEERLVALAGWRLFASSRDGRGVTVIGGAGTVDGMCRPDQYQDFVFVNGKFAGTISPTLMNARSDGGAVKITFPAAVKILVEFSRFTDKDPLCCPSRISEGTFEIRYEGGKPVVVLTGVKTRRT